MTPQPSLKPDPSLTPEQELIALLSALYDAPIGTDQRKSLERRLFAWVEAHLRQNLKAIMFKTFGPQVAGDTSLRFTTLWNDVVAKVLQKGLKELQREPSLLVLADYFSKALANQARDYLKRRKRGEEILELAIRPLVESREKHLWEKHRIELDRLLDEVDRWQQAGDPRGAVLRYYYIDGQTYKQIGQLMDLSPDRVKHLKQAALLELKRLSDRS